MMAQFNGILGLWSWPLLNRLLALIDSNRTATSGLYSMGPRETMKNAEKWAIVRDGKGRISALEIHRTVEETQ